MKTLLSASIRVEIIAIAALNFLFSITASLGNILILITLRKVTSIHPPTKLLFQCLAITDLGVGLISQPLMATLMLLVDNILNIMFSHLLSSLSITFCGVSVFASTALSVDRLSLALLLGLGYRHVVTLKRVRAVLACVCVTALLIVLLWNFRVKTDTIIITIFLTLCLIISLSCYTNIVLRLCQHHSKVQDNAQRGQANTGGIPLNLERYKRTVVSIALVQLALFICYFPFLIFRIVTHLKDIHPGLYLLWYSHTTTLVFLNSSLNPFLYCWRITIQAVKGTIRRFFCRSNSSVKTQ